MNIQLPAHMDKPSFLAWLQGREGRYELVGGRVLMMTGGTMAHGLIVGNVFQMLRAGASGYILKDAGKNELFAAIRAVNSGDRSFSPGISKMMIDEFVNRAHANGAKPPAQKPLLTKREIEVLKLIAEGLTNPEIASRLYLSARTVDTHRTNLMRKLKIHDIAGLVTYAITRSIMDPKTKS